MQPVTYNRKITEKFEQSDYGDAQQHFLAQRVLYREAELLDSRRYAEWLEMLSDDLLYEMPLRTNRLGRELQFEFNDPGELSHFEEDKGGIALRLRRLGTNMAWSEDPPSRTRRLVSNIVVKSASEGEVLVGSNQLVYRSRLDHQKELFSCARFDIWRIQTDPAAWQLAYRNIVFDDAIVHGSNLGIFF
ncbi:aromatic-ring-hydroxylating dioxygenase subunit beta [Haliea sp.]